MRILHVITSLEIGGAQRLLADMLPLQSESANVSLLVYERVGGDFEKAVEQAGIKIISLNEHNFYNPAVIFRMRKIFKDYDVVHAHLFPTLYWASLAARGLKLKIIYTEHSTSNNRRNKWYFRQIERFMYSRYDRIVSISLQTQEALQNWLRSKDNRFVIINNGVDTQHFASIKKCIIPDSLIMVSRFASSKDQETVIRAMRMIDSKAIVRFVGDGPNLEHCKRIAQECGVCDRVQFLGARSDVAELIAESYIGIQSSNWEGFGLTAVEIMACGKPVVATDVDGLRQVVEGAGKVFHKGRAQELAAIVNNLLAERNHYNRIAYQCLARASQYDIHAVVDNYMKVYQQFI